MGKEIGQKSKKKLNLSSTIDHSRDQDTTIRLKKIYHRGFDQLSPTPSAAYVGSSPLALKKEQLKQLKLNVTAIASKIKGVRTEDVANSISALHRDYLNSRKKVYALSPSPLHSSTNLMNQSLE